jgi:nucleotide sugar dehydrogenase
VLYNPEFIAQGSIIRDLIHPDQVLIGEDSSESGDRLVSLYKRFIKSDPAYCRMDPLSAEITKLATNCFLTTKISFANAIGDMTKNLGGNPEAVLSAIGKDSRIGSKYLNYGFGFGGPCFPRDNQAMISAAKSINMPLYLAEATVRVNEEHLNFQLNEQLQENRSIYIFDYVSYKPGTDILVEAQQLKLATELVRQGKKVLIRNSELVRSQLEEMYPGYFEFE